MPGSESISEHEHDAVLRLSDLSIKEVPTDLMKRKGVTELYLDYNELSHLPAVLFDCCQCIRKLSVIGNNIETVSEEIAKWSQIEELYLNENELTSLPDALSLCRNLRILNVVGNALKKLPNSFSDLERLEAIHADENLLEKLPDGFDSLTCLRVAEFSCNKIKSLPPVLGGLSNLSVLNLSGNKLTVVPESLGDIKTLTVLDLSDNCVRVLPETFGSERVIRKLYIESNGLEELPAWFARLASVEELSVKDNQLKGSALPAGLGETSARLRLLDMSGNFITDLPENVGGLENLEVIHFGSVIGELERRNFQNGNWICKLPESFSNLTNLKRMNFEENQIKKLPTEMGNLVHLEYIDLGQNKLHVLPHSFGELANLHTCLLSKNHIEALPDSFGNLARLTDLRLDNNLLTQLPESFGKLTQLRSLDLFNNRLREIPVCLGDFRQLVQLDIAENEIPLHHLKVPKLEKRVEYAPRDPLLQDNWRGRPRKGIGESADSDLKVYGEGNIPDEPEAEYCEDCYNENALQYAVRRNLSLWKTHTQPENQEREKFVRTSNDPTQCLPPLAISDVQYDVTGEFDDAEECNGVPFRTAGYGVKCHGGLADDFADETLEERGNESKGNESHTAGSDVRDDTSLSTSTDGGQHSHDTEDWDEGCGQIQAVYPCGMPIMNGHYKQEMNACLPSLKHPLNVLRHADYAQMEDGQFDDAD